MRQTRVIAYNAPHGDKPGQRLVRGILLSATLLSLLTIAGCDKAVEVGFKATKAVAERMTELEVQRKNRCRELVPRRASERSSLENALLRSLRGQGRLGEPELKEVFCRRDPQTIEDSCVLVYTDGTNELRYCNWLSGHEGGSAQCKLYGTTKKWGFGPVATTWQPYEICR